MYHFGTSTWRSLLHEHELKTKSISIVFLRTLPFPSFLKNQLLRQHFFSPSVLITIWLGRLGNHSYLNGVSSGIAPVSRRSWVRIPLKPQKFFWAFFPTARAIKYLHLYLCSANHFHFLWPIFAIFAIFAIFLLISLLFQIKRAYCTLPSKTCWLSLLKTSLQSQKLSVNLWTNFKVRVLLLS